MAPMLSQVSRLEVSYNAFSSGNDNGVVVYTTYLHQGLQLVTDLVIQHLIQKKGMAILGGGKLLDLLFSWNLRQPFLQVSFILRLVRLP